MGLDDEQREVATTFGVPVHVVAGAGTGKTRAITHRIAHGVATGVMEPRHTLAVTFTTRAAGTMKARLEHLGVRGVQARTIHSAALRQIQYFWPQAYGCELPTVSDQRFAMVAEASRRAGLGVDTALLRDLSGEISWSKVSNVTPEEYPDLALAGGRVVADVSAQTVGRVLSGYEAVKRERGVIDLDDILLCAVGLLCDHPDVAEQVRDQYRHFVVDEYQDLSPVQHTLLELWYDDRPDVCVVGDPHQSIHAFAGARPDYLLDFGRDHPGATRIDLVRNYRSTRRIIGLANDVLTHRVPATERAHHRGGVQLVSQGAEGQPPVVGQFDDEAAEAAAVAGWLVERHRAGTEWSQMAVLHRINAQAPGLEAALSAAGVPYLVKGAERFYDRAEVRRALNALSRAASRAGEEPAVEATEEVLSGCGWTPTPPAGQGSVRERWESLEAIHDLVVSMARDRADLTLAGVAQEMVVRARTQEVPRGDAVTVCTMHASKGLEWDDVAVVGLSEGLVPFALSTTPEEMAEERRLLHVAVTRARSQLWLSWASATTGRRQAGPSRFLAGMALTASLEKPRRPRPRRTRRAATCRLCGGVLTAARDRKLGHHLACEVDVDPAVVDRLRAWRLAQAEADRVPAFVVLTDASLLAVAERMPRTPEELLEIPGIGRRKVERYAAHLLEELHGSSAT